ncbi:MAG: hypothetical protein VYC34_01775 [Planctomycetota bacterium]|nr:hypothetical protein [Planctomycetota bacterium]
MNNMDKRSLLMGMTIGGALALGGILLGGMQARQPANDPGQRPNQPQPRVLNQFDLIQCREIQLVNIKGQEMMKLRAEQACGLISVYDSFGDEIVRIAGVLRGGGYVATKEQGRTMTSLSSVPTGGQFVVNQLQDGKTVPAFAVRAGKAGGFVYTYDPELDITSRLPEQKAGEPDQAHEEPGPDAASGEPQGQD